MTMCSMSIDRANVVFYPDNGNQDLSAVSSGTNLVHLLCSTGFHALGLGTLHGPTVACTKQNPKSPTELRSPKASKLTTQFNTPPRLASLRTNFTLDPPKLSAQDPNSSPASAKASVDARRHLLVQAVEEEGDVVLEAGDSCGDGGPTGAEPRVGSGGVEAVGVGESGARHGRRRALDLPPGISRGHRTSCARRRLGFTPPNPDSSSSSSSSSSCGNGNLQG